MKIQIRNNIASSGLAVGLGCAAALLSAGVSAARFDGASNLVCAAMDVVGCASGQSCIEGQARDFELPQFIFVDFANQLVRGTEEGGQQEVSPIRQLDVTENQVILQGVENHRGWSVAIDRQTGRMTLTSAGGDVGFMIFGACTAL